MTAQIPPTILSMMARRNLTDIRSPFPSIVSGALELPQESFVIDGEVVVLDKDGVSDFDALSSRQHDNRAQLYAFDILAGDGEDYRSQALVMRKASLARLLSRPVDGIFIAEYEQRAECEQGEIGDILFRVACNMGLEGIVSKRLDRAYGVGRCKFWIKVKNRAHPAYSRVRDASRDHFSLPQLRPAPSLFGARGWRFARWQRRSADLLKLLLIK
jgi:bifunctional non-homologous end joining protein LigD